MLYHNGGGKPLIKVRFAYFVLVTPGVMYKVNTVAIVAKIILVSDSFFTGESCLNFISPHKYNDSNTPTMIHIPINISLFKMPQCITKSALDKNLNASPNSKKPSTTFTVVSQPPLFGKDFNIPGKSANNAKGNARANPKPPMPAVNCIAPPSAVKEPANNDPNIGPVQENETSASVSAIKKIPTAFPAPALLSVLLVKDAGKVISYTPKNDKAKMMKMIKNPTLR